MKLLHKTLPLALALSFASVYAQTESTSNPEQKMEETAKAPEKPKAEKPNIKNNSNLFQQKKRTWSVGLHGGYPLLLGDMTPQMGMAYGLEIRKALGYSFSLRLNATNGYATGANWKRNSYESLKRNNGVNGVNNAASDYYGAKKEMYANYKMNFTQATIDALFNFNNVNFLSENPRFGVYAIAGIGALLSDTWIDQLDASGNMYDYSNENIPRASNYKDRKTTFDKLEQIRDGKYETKGDGNSYDGKFMDKNLDIVGNIGVGFNYRLSKRIGLSLESTYMYTGNDLLDGQRWFSADHVTQSPDAMVNINLGLQIRLGRVDNVDWFSNPLSMPYKTIMENKKKLAKVDKLEKDVDDVNKRLDTINNDVASLKADADGDGVSDFFDKEDSTLADAVVNGAGETILFKNKDGDLVFNDPTIARKKQQIKDGILNEDGSPAVNADGSSSTTDEYGNTIKQPIKKSKVRFDANDPDGKTVFFKGNGSGGYNSPGTSSSFGYMPAVFFNTNNASISQNAYPQLYEIARILKQNPNVKISVIGHADSRNTEAYNKQLGMQRAKAVKNMLVKNFGVNENQLIAESRGEVEPLSNAKGMSALAANRRVQFEITGGKTDTKAPAKNNVQNPAEKKAEVKKETPKEDINTPAPEELNNDLNQFNQDNTPADTSKSTDDVFTPGNDF